MTRNGRTTPFPNELTTPPTWRSQTRSGAKERHVAAFCEEHGARLERDR
jgi:hypothetical protein